MKISKTPILLTATHIGDFCHKQCANLVKTDKAEYTCFAFSCSWLVNDGERIQRSERCKKAEIKFIKTQAPVQKSFELSEAV